MTAAVASIQVVTTHQYVGLVYTTASAAQLPLELASATAPFTASTGKYEQHQYTEELPLLSLLFN